MPSRGRSRRSKVAGGNTPEPQNGVVPGAAAGRVLPDPEEVARSIPLPDRKTMADVFLEEPPLAPLRSDEYEELDESGPYEDYAEVWGIPPGDLNAINPVLSEAQDRADTLQGFADQVAVEVQQWAQVLRHVRGTTQVDSSDMLPTLLLLQLIELRTIRSMIEELAAQPSV